MKDCGARVRARFCPFCAAGDAMAVVHGFLTTDVPVWASAIVALMMTLAVALPAWLDADRLRRERDEAALLLQHDHTAGPDAPTVPMVRLERDGTFVDERGFVFDGGRLVGVGAEPAPQWVVQPDGCLTPR